MLYDVDERLGASHRMGTTLCMFLDEPLSFRRPQKRTTIKPDSFLDRYFLILMPPLFVNGLHQPSPGLFSLVFSFTFHDWCMMMR